MGHKIRRTFAEVGESDVPVEQLDLVEAGRQGLADVDSVESVSRDQLLSDFRICRILFSFGGLLLSR